MKLSKISTAQFIILLTITLLLLMNLMPAASVQKVAGADNASAPNKPVKLIFIHHSTGENWLADDNGGLGVALMKNNYFVSDTNYGWGPDSIGDMTDIGHWWTWFRGPESHRYLSALYRESGQHSSYSRLSKDPGGENEIVMFKSCFPNSDVWGNPGDPVPPIESNPLRGNSTPLTIENCKGIYLDILNYFRTRPDKLFIVITAPPMTSLREPSTNRAFNNWLVNDWLRGYPYKNVFVFDFYNVLTTNGGSPDINDLGWERGNHHRWWKGRVQHKTDGGSDLLAYPSGEDHTDNHPSIAGNRKATAEFVPLLNVAYNRFKGHAPEPEPEPSPPSTRVAATNSIGVTEPARTWYLAEGCTSGGFETWILVQNPSDSPANVTLTYQTDEGNVQGPSFMLPAKSRESVNVGETVTTYRVATTVSADRGVIAERAVYLAI